MVPINYVRPLKQCAVATKHLIALVLALPLVSCYHTPDPDVMFFMQHHTSNQKDWMATLPRQRQVDMFFAAHRVRPSSDDVDVWITRHDPSLLTPIRSALDHRGNEYDIDGFLLTVEVLAEEKRLSKEEIAALRLASLCSKVNSQQQVCHQTNAGSGN
jgi:hypothetical protein